MQTNREKSIAHFHNQIILEIFHKVAQKYYQHYKNDKKDELN